MPLLVPRMCRGLDSRARVPAPTPADTLRGRLPADQELAGSRSVATRLGQPLDSGTGRRCLPRPCRKPAVLPGPRRSLVPRSCFDGGVVTGTCVSRGLADAASGQPVCQCGGAVAVGHRVVVLGCVTACARWPRSCHVHGRVRCRQGHRVAGAGALHRRHTSEGKVTRRRHVGQWAESSRLAGDQYVNLSAAIGLRQYMQGTGRSPSATAPMIPRGRASAIRFATGGLSHQDMDIAHRVL